MTIKIQHHRSKLYEFLMVPAIVSKDFHFMKEGLLQEQKAILEDIFPLYEKVYHELLHLQKEIISVSLFDGYTAGLALVLYLYLLEEGKDPKDMKQLLADLKQLNADQLRYCLALKLYANTEEFSDKAEELLLFLEKSDKSPADKWYWYQAIQHPEKLRDQLLVLLEKAAAIYQPIYDRLEPEVLEFEEHFTLDQIAETENLQEILLEKEAQLFVLSPFFIEHFVEKIDSFVTIPYSVVISTRTEKLLVAGQTMNEELLAATLKTLGDETRYQVLVELVKPHAKNKEIAKKLGITTPSVSFHTQKLLNSGLLEIDAHRSSFKYVINQNLIQQIIAKLKDDLQIQDQKN